MLKCYVLLFLDIEIRPLT